MPIIDFQTQLFSERVASTLPVAARKWGKFWSKPVSLALHEVQPFVRFLPSIGRTLVEEFGALAPLSHLLFESSLEDLGRSMEKYHVDRAVILSDPTNMENAGLLDIAKNDPRFISAIRIPRGAGGQPVDAKTLIDQAHEEGCRILQIHPASDGIDANSEIYQSQLEAAAAHGWLVILQTGSPKAHLVYRKPENTTIDRYDSWFKTWPKTPFVIARMNFDEPEHAMDFAETYSNLYLETSWQPAETIAEAVRRIGSDRILFGSDWPIMGNNQKIGICRIRDAVDAQMISESDGKNILGVNAEVLLKQIGETR